VDTIGFTRVPSTRHVKVVEIPGYLFMDRMIKPPAVGFSVSFGITLKHISKSLFIKQNIKHDQLNVNADKSPYIFNVQS